MTMESGAKRVLSSFCIRWPSAFAEACVWEGITVLDIPSEDTEKFLADCGLDSGVTLDGLPVPLEDQVGEFKVTKVEGYACYVEPYYTLWGRAKRAASGAFEAVGAACGVIICWVCLVCGSTCYYKNMQPGRGLMKEQF